MFPRAGAVAGDLPRLPLGGSGGEFLFKINRTAGAEAMSGQSERIHIQIQGRVQGVFFRASSREKAKDLGLSGWVRNRPDRQVEIVAEGTREALEALLAWCRTGPPLAHVKSVETEWSGSTGEYSSFEVR